MVWFFRHCINVLIMCLTKFHLFKKINPSHDLRNTSFMTTFIFPRETPEGEKNKIKFSTY